MLSPIGIDVFFLSEDTKLGRWRRVLWKELEEGMHMIKVILHKILKELSKKQKEWEAFC